ncbi:MAG TPA: alpha/beta fold hydrolase [Vicinamibacterales bacterium]
MIAALAWALLAFAQAPPMAGDPIPRAQTIVGDLTAGRFDAIEAQYTDQMKAALPAGRLAATWSGVIGQVGEFQKIVNSREERSGTVRIAVITCAFAKASLDVRVAFDPSGKLAGLSMRPAATTGAPYALPSYADRSSFTDSGVMIGTGDWKLPGTLTLPKGDGPFPAVALIHGSGPNDRDETIGPNKPFADLGAGLASRGIAVLRFDKRTMVYGAKMAAAGDITVKDEFIDDALAAIQALRANPHIDAKRVFVLGHSEGGMLIPRIASADPSIAGLIVMAGAARPIEDALVEQTEYLANADGVVTPEEQKQIDQMKQIRGEIRALTPADAAAHKVVFHAPASYWLDLRGYDPPAAARAVKQPMLVLQGERDYQVTMAEFARWKAALDSKPTVTFRSYPALNHLMIAGTGKSLPAEYGTPGHVDQQVVDDIAVWIKSGKLQ